MLIKNPNHTISFSIFSKFPELLCIMSTRTWGDLNVGIKPIENVRPLLDAYKIPLKKFVSMRQRHSLNIEEVFNIQGGTLIEDSDGLITKDRLFFLGVKAADCVPLFFYDPIQKIVAVAHAGWRVTLGKIVVEIIKKMQKSGSDPKNIYVAIGPHIGGCCYDVPEERALLFMKLYSSSEPALAGESRSSRLVVARSNNKWYLDLGFINRLQLLNSGIPLEHIDSPIICTSCQNDTYFSYRKEGPDNFGEMLGIIGVRNNE